VIALEYAGAAVFALVGLVAVVLTPVGVPGAWMMLGIAGTVDVTAMLFGAGRPLPFGAWALAVAVTAAALGEALEFVAGAMGAKAGGASRSGVVGSMVGGFAGVIAGTLLVPMPVLGSVVGALVGVVAGAVIGETLFHGRSVGASVRPAAGAALGRLLGSVAKLPCSMVAWVVLVYDAFT
jgi:uncharacterized protein YqgC (DUF456 family)